MSTFISSRSGRGVRNDLMKETWGKGGRGRRYRCESELLKVERRRREILTRVKRGEGGDDETRSRVRIRNRNWRCIIHSFAVPLIFAFRIRDLNCKTMENPARSKGTCYD